MHWDDRGQSIQIGAVLIFGALIVALSGYQAFVVPQQNEQVEFSHSQTVQDDLTDLRNAFASVPGAASTQSVGVRLGTRYPERILAVNPGPPSGALRSAETAESQVALSVENGVATGETGDVWNGTERAYGSGWLVYRPNYNVYDGAPTTYYEHSVLFNEFDGGSVPLTEQTLVDGERISLVALNGSLRSTRAGVTSVDVRPVSAPSRTVAVRNQSATENVTIRVPTRLTLPTWQALLSEEMVDEDGHVWDVRTEPLAAVSGAQTLVVELERGVTYDLELAKAGVGTRVTETSEAYMTDVSGNGSAVPEEGSQLLVVEVRDAYNNPVAGVDVTGDPDLGTLDETTVRTGEDGRATFVYNAPSVASETVDAVEFSYPGGASSLFNADDPEDVEMVVEVQNTQVDSVTGGGGAPYSLVWQSPATDITIDVGAEGDTKTLQALVEDATVADTPTVEGANVDFALNNSTVGTLSPEDGTTDVNGEVSTTFTAENNGTVRIYGVSGGASDFFNVTVTNVTGAASGSVGFRVDDLTFIDQNQPSYVASYDATGFSDAAAVAIEFRNTDSPSASATETSTSLRGSITYDESFGADDEYEITVRVLDSSGTVLASKSITDVADAQNPTADNGDLAETTDASLNSYEITDDANANSNKVEYLFDYSVSSGDFTRVKLVVLSTDGSGIANTVDRTLRSGTDIQVPPSSDDQYGTGSPFRVGIMVYDGDGAVVELVDTVDTADGGNAVVLSGTLLLLALLGITGVKRRIAARRNRNE